MKIKKWVKHIISRFGKSIALQFACGCGFCPCGLVDWECTHCSYSRINKYGEVERCIESTEFVVDTIDNPMKLIKIKKRILKKIKKVNNKWVKNMLKRK